MLFSDSQQTDLSMPFHVLSLSLDKSNTSSSYSQVRPSLIKRAALCTFVILSSAIWLASVTPVRTREMSVITNISIGILHHPTDLSTSYRCAGTCMGYFRALKSAYTVSFLSLDPHHRHRSFINSGG